jgi:hypothetical protein
MILKEANNHKIHRLRVLHLYEADYNLILRVKWRQLMRHAEANHTLNEGQYGSRAGREASSLNFLETLKTRSHTLHADPFSVWTMMPPPATTELLFRSPP